MKDNEFPNALRVIADKLENDFKGNILECKEDLYEVSCELVMRFEELEDEKLKQHIDTSKVSQELQEWRDSI